MACSGKFFKWGFDMLKPMMKVQKQQTLTNSLDDKDNYWIFTYGKMDQWSPDQAGECFRQFMKIFTKKTNL